MPLHVFRPLTQGSYECTFVRRNQITIGSITDEQGTTINNLILNSFLISQGKGGLSPKYPIGNNFTFCTFGKLTIKISHIVPICINTIGTTATDLAQFQITPYLIGGIFDDGEFGEIQVKGSYNHFIHDNILTTQAPQGSDILKAPKCFTLSAGQIYTYEKDIPNPPGRFYYKTPQLFNNENVYILPSDSTSGTGDTFKVKPFVPQKNYASIPQSPHFPIITLGMQWFDALDSSTNKPRLFASAMLETELQMTFYTDSDTITWRENNNTIELEKVVWIEENGPIRRQPNFYRT